NIRADNAAVLNIFFITLFLCSSFLYESTFFHVVLFQSDRLKLGWNQGLGRISVKSHLKYFNGLMVSDHD
ncbi:MAG: hypothetical protein D3918_05795, partial [Candidatus Electrothrix sp. AX2]|nr:hypothetical protein [Candidatus Electrothrix gigas]